MFLLKQLSFSVCLELINTTSIFKESARDSKKIKRPVSVLLVLSKLSESCWANNWRNLNESYQNFNVVLGERNRRDIYFLMMLENWTESYWWQKCFWNWAVKRIWLLKLWFVDCWITCIRRVSIREQGGGLSCLFLKIKEKCPDFEKRCPVCMDLWINFSFKFQF